MAMHGKEHHFRGLPWQNLIAGLMPWIWLSWHRDYEVGTLGHQCFPASSLQLVNVKITSLSRKRRRRSYNFLELAASNKQIIKKNHWMIPLEAGWTLSDSLYKLLKRGPHCSRFSFPQQGKLNWPLKLFWQVLVYVEAQWTLNQYHDNITESHAIPLNVIIDWSKFLLFFGIVLKKKLYSYQRLLRNMWLFHLLHIWNIFLEVLLIKIYNTVCNLQIYQASTQTYVSILLKVRLS